MSRAKLEQSLSSTTTKKWGPNLWVEFFDKWKPIIILVGKESEPSLIKLAATKRGVVRRFFHDMDLGK